MIGVIIPVHNEASVLEACLGHVLRAASDPLLGGEQVRIFVALDACSDDSGSVARAWGADTVTCSGRNVGAARACAADLAMREGVRWLASTDADSLVPEYWLSAQLACRADAVCGTVRVVDWTARSGYVRARHNSHYQSRNGHRHVHGANLGVAAHAYRRAGGFAADSCGEDVSLVCRLQRLHACIAWVAHPCVVTSARHSRRCPGGFSSHLDRLEWNAVRDAVME